jgi:hypothetical protein
MICNRDFRNTSYLLPMTLPGFEIHIVLQRNRVDCLCKITSVWWILYLILVWKRNSVNYLWVNSGAVYFKNIRKRPNVQCWNCFRFQQLVCAKLECQGIGQQNLNIVTDWTSLPTWEFSCLQSLPNLKDFVRRRNNTILHTSSLWGKIECILK